MPTAERAPRAVTAGVIASELGVSRDRVMHVLRSRLHIAPVARAGNTRLFAREVIAMVRHELNAIDARREPQRDRARRDPSLFDAGNPKGGGA